MKTKKASDSEEKLAFLRIRTLENTERSKMRNKDNLAEKEKSPFRLWIENYFYHYKWITVFGVFFLIVAIVCIVQMVKNDSYDSYVMYAGPYELSHKQVLDIQKEFNPFVGDKDGDGEINVAMRELFVMSPEEITRFEAENEGYEANVTLISNNMQVFDNEILSGEATICLLSPFLFERVCKADGFLPVSEYIGGSDVELYNEYGVLLSSTEFGKLSALAYLPDDTVFCVRRVSTIASLFGKKEAERNHERNLEAVRAIFEME